jgi:hypothetical protein
MKSTVHPHRTSVPRVVVACSVLVAFALSVSTAGALASEPNPNPGILPPSSHAFGKTYGAWSAAWWQYYEAQPVSSNPAVDPTGAGCRKAQSGKVFFLVGANGSGSVTRDQCTVPAGKALFFPLLDVVDVNIPPVEPVKTPLETWEELEGVFGGASELFASVDGVALANLDPATTPYRVCAGPVARCSAPSFSVFLPAENFFGPFVPEGTYAPAVADGFFLLLAPLKPGPHTITFGGTGLFLGGTFTQNITYHLEVVPGG